MEEAPVDRCWQGNHTLCFDILCILCWKMDWPYSVTNSSDYLRMVNKQVFLVNKIDINHYMAKTDGDIKRSIDDSSSLQAGIIRFLFNLFPNKSE